MKELKGKAEKQAESGIDEEWVHQGKDQSFHPSPVRDAIVKFIRNIEETLGESDPTEKAFVELPADTKANYHADFKKEGGCCTYEYFFTA